MNSPLGKTIIGAVAVLSMAACSTAPYRGPIKDFGKAAGTASAAASQEMDAIISEARSAAQAAGQLQVRTLEATLEPTTDCELVNNPKACNLFAAGAPDIALIATFDKELEAAKVPRAKQIVSVLGSYASGLEAITAAEDHEKLRDASASVASSVGRVVSLAGAEGLAISAVIQPVIRVAGEVAILGLEHRRWRVLQTVVPQVDGSIEVLGKQLDAAIFELRGVRLVATNSVLFSARQAWNEGDKSEKSAARLTAALLAFRTAAADAAKPAPFSKMIKAHGKLVEYMQGDRSAEQLAAFVENVGELQSAVGELKTALGEL